jgi:hypothetical protein
VLLNLGQGNFANPVDLPESRNGFSVAVGDLNADGALDIVLGRSTDRSQIYFNDGQGHFSSFVPLSTHGRTISDVALGDLDSDGALDIVLSAENFFSPFLPIQIYHNDGQGHFGTPAVVSAGVSSAFRVVLGDLNGDGALDLIANIDNANKIYLNDGRGNFSRSNILPGASGTIYIALGDVNGDGALDIVTNYHQPWIFFNQNDGTGSFLAPIELTSVSTYAGLSVGDLDGDGVLDIVAGKQIYRNRLFSPTRLPNRPPTVAIHRPGSTPDADFYSTPALLTDRVIPINYTLSDPDGDRVGAIRGFYSLDGGGTWHPAIAATGTITSNLTAASGTNYITGCMTSVYLDTCSLHRLKEGVSTIFVPAMIAY